MPPKRFSVILKKVLVALLVTATVVLTGFIVFTLETFSLTRSERTTDAIVVLTGGQGRVEEGIRLYRSGRARWLLLSGVDPAVQRKELYREKRGENLAAGVLLEKSSRTTLENALYVRDLLGSRNIRSIQLLTSRYHLPRSLLIFRQMLPKDVVIYPYPVESPHLKPTVWWRQPLGLRLLVKECYKYWLFRCFFLFGGELASTTPE
jgi:uncharacterized SAM-binding protein YcdF (DUF218 family)